MNARWPLQLRTAFASCAQSMAATVPQGLATAPAKVATTQRALPLPPPTLDSPVFPASGSPPPTLTGTTLFLKGRLGEGNGNTTINLSSSPRQPSEPQANLAHANQALDQKGPEHASRRSSVCAYNIISPLTSSSPRRLLPPGFVFSSGRS